MEVVEYLDEQERSSFADWLDGLDPTAAARIVVAIARMESGNLGHCKSLGKGLWENKLTFGPGYRIYFAYDGNEIIVLLAGGNKGRQSSDIKKARERLERYQLHKRRSKWH